MTAYDATNTQAFDILLVELFTEAGLNATCNSVEVVEVGQNAFRLELFNTATSQRVVGTDIYASPFSPEAKRSLKSTFARIK